MVTIIIIITIIMITVIMITNFTIIIRENVAVVNVFLNAPQTSILDVNEKTSIIDAVKDDDDDEHDDFDNPDSDNDDGDESDDNLIAFCRFLVLEVFLVSSWASLLSRLQHKNTTLGFSFVTVTTKT